MQYSINISAKLSGRAGKCSRIYAFYIIYELEASSYDVSLALPFIIQLHPSLKLH